MFGPGDYFKAKELSKIDYYLTQKDCIAHRLTNFVMNMSILCHPQTLFIGLAADYYLSEHILSRPLIPRPAVLRS